MFTLISGLKKMGSTRLSYVHDLIQNPVNKILDVGCSYGWTLDKLTGKAEELWGVDTDVAALSQAKVNYPHIKFVLQTAACLPFENNTFDVVILSEVIEHVGDENKKLVVDEVWRVLKEGGMFIFTAPYDGLFAWADPLDFKRRLPAVYRIYMSFSNYTPNTSIEVGHKHLSLDEINQLFDDRFQIEDIQYCGLFMPFINWILAVGERLRLLPLSFRDALNGLQSWESGVQYPQPLAFNIRIKAYKKVINTKSEA